MASTGGRPIDLEQLQKELAEAGIEAPYGLTMQGKLIHTYDENGQPDDLPSGAETVIEAHVPSTALQDKVVQTAEVAVGAEMDKLTDAQRQGLVEALLFRFGAFDKYTLKVLPLEQWALPLPLPSMPAPPLPVGPMPSRRA